MLESRCGRCLLVNYLYGEYYYSLQVNYMGRPKKTGLKTRSFYVYADTDEQAERWKKAADEAGLKVSKYFREIMERHFSGTSGATYQSLERRVKELENTNITLREENNELSHRTNWQSKALERLESENRKLRSGKFLENNFEGIREIEKDLIDLLKKSGYVNEHEILDKLHINPRELDSTKTISRQLETLLDYGLLKKWKGGYKWTG